MKCKHCGFEAKEDFVFCPNCSKKQDEESVRSGSLEVSLNPVADFVLNVLRDKLFLVLCILVSSSTLFALANDSINIIGILMTVFLWLTYASAYKGITDEKQLRNVSGTYYAGYIISWVAAILVLVMGALFTFVFGVIATSGELMESILDEMEFTFEGFATEVITGILSVSVVWIFVIFTLIGVALILVLHFAVKPTHRFIQSVYKSVEAGEPTFCSVSTAKNWLLISGILSGFSAVGSLLGGNMSSFLSAGSTAAAAIIGSILIDKYFIKSAIN